MKADARDDFKDGNEGLNDPARRERLRPEEPWIQLTCEVKTLMMDHQKKLWSQIEDGAMFLFFI